MATSYQLRVEHERKCREARDFAGVLGYENLDDRDDNDLCADLEIDGFTWDGYAWKADPHGELRDALAERSNFESGRKIGALPVNLSALPLFNQPAEIPIERMAWVQPGEEFYPTE
jgi:hypothetical protein